MDVTSCGDGDSSGGDRGGRGSGGNGGSGDNGAASTPSRQLSPKSSCEHSVARKLAGISPGNSAPVSEDEIEEMERTSRSSFSEEGTGTIDFNNDPSFDSSGTGTGMAESPRRRLRSLSTSSTHSNNSTSSANSGKATVSTAAAGTTTSATAEGIELLVGDATRLALDDATFSKVVSIDSAYYFSTRDTFFGEAFRVLVPGGRLCVADICLQNYPTSCIGKFILFIICLFAGVPRANMCACDEYMQVLNRTGFVNVQCRETLDNEVFLGYANFMRQQKFKYKGAVRSSLFSPHSAAASFFSFVGRMGWLSFIVVTADKPVEGAPLANVNFRVSPPAIRSLRSASSLYQHA
jgi:SAM-dependent methyltransferase